MIAVEYILIVLLLVVVLPISAYMIAKFGAAGYFRAKRRDTSQKQNKTNEK